MSTNLGNVGNPSAILFHAHEKNILSVRETLFASISSISVPMAKAAEDILMRKIDQAGGKSTVRLFEIFPWVLKDLADLSWHKTHDVSVNWLAVYLYVTFLDDHLDSKTNIKAEEFLGASILAQKGLLNLFKVVHGTKYESLFTNALLSSASSQLTDVLEQAEVKTEQFGKASSASGKNNILIACAGALAAACNTDSPFIIDFTKKLLLAVQLLDDLADFEEDFSRNNVTILLNDIYERNHDLQSKYSRKDILSKLVESGSLLNVIKRISNSMQAAKDLLSTNVRHKTRRPSVEFFQTIHKTIVSFESALSVYKIGYSSLSSIEKDTILDEVDNYVSRIYLHT